MSRQKKDKMGQRWKNLKKNMVFFFWHVWVSFFLLCLGIFTLTKEAHYRRAQ